MHDSTELFEHVANHAGRPDLVTNAGTDTANFLVLQRMGDYDCVAGTG
jgi:hypothetical protein